MADNIPTEIDLSCCAEHLTDKQLALVRMVFDFKETGAKVHISGCGIDPRRFGLSDALNTKLDVTVISKYALELLTEAKEHPSQNN